MAQVFSQFGIEIETMIVDRESLGLRSLSDTVLRDSNGHIVSSLRHGPITWSNELVMHVLEFKTSLPVKQLEGLSGQFHESMLLADKLLKKAGGGLLGTAIHPWFDPFDGVKIWPHEDREIYDTFDRIFDSRGHGWSNLQSFHLNLPFEVGDDESFRRLHSAIRLVLPLVPVLASSSPLVEGRKYGLLDSRLDMYRKNCLKVPSITGGVIPDVYRSQEEYQEKVFDVIRRDLKLMDPEGILEPEWTNARGAIGRFDRGSIEIRVGDAQECPGQDLAVIQMIIQLVRDWYENKHVSLEDQESVSSETLRTLFNDAINLGRYAKIKDEALFQVYGGGNSRQVGDVLKNLVPENQEWSGSILMVLEEGNLAERILRAIGPTINPESIFTVYQRLRKSLLVNQPFIP
jgi:glutamate---cysteine ligase / carboxylate-amine ligase